MTTTRILIVLAVLFNFLQTDGQELIIGQSFSSDTTLYPFSGIPPVSTLKISGHIHLNSDTSLIRIIAVSTDAIPYLVYEAYPLIVTNNDFILHESSEETKFLNFVQFEKLKIEIVNASVELDTLIYSSDTIQNVLILNDEWKHAADSIKVVTINQNIHNLGMYWRAGMPNEPLFYAERENIFGPKNNISGFEYYKGGIFERAIRNYAHSTATYTPEFSWRSRHNSDNQQSPYYDGDPNATGWLTPFEDQYTTNSCWAFSAVGTVESVANIYYNIHGNTTNPFHLDPDLSELQAVKCSILAPPPPSPPPPMCLTLGWPSYAFSFFVSNGINNDLGCTPFSCTNLNNPSLVCGLFCPNSTYKIKINSFSNVSYSIEDNIKLALITKGPLSACLQSPNHCMVLFGYKVLTGGDLLYKGTGADDADIILDHGSRLDGSTKWYFKDSQVGGGNPPWVYIMNPDSNWSSFTYMSSIDGISLEYLDSTPPPETQCSDEDKDGYYWWGVRLLSPECNCPPTVNANEEDCNDNNKNLGPYEADYGCRLNCVSDNNVLHIDQSSVDNMWFTDRHISHDIIIESGGVLTILSSVFFTPGAKIIVKPGGLLKLMFPAKLTSGCQDFWGGIELRGDPWQPQSSMYQGKVVIDNGIIENAICGIKTFNPGAIPNKSNSTPVPDGYSSGGIVCADNATIRYCRTGVEFFPYKFSNTNFSYFNHCTFIDSVLLHNAPPGDLLKLDGVAKIKIRGCTFRNTDPNILAGTKGRGIYAFNSSISLDRLGSDSCTFENLDYGVYCINSGTSGDSIHICRSRFMDNKYGVYLSGLTAINPSEINSNYFGIQTYTDNASKYQLYLDHSTGFHVTLNRFRNNVVTVGGEKNYHGVIVNNSGTHMDYIYNNDFANLKYALHGQNRNWGNYIPEDVSGKPGIEFQYQRIGLCFICNDFHNCSSDIVINRDPANPPPYSGINYFQRNSAYVTNPVQKPASNTFSLNHDPAHPTLYDIDIDANPTVGSIQYTEHVAAFLNEKVIPTNISNPGKVKHDPVLPSVVYSKDLSCPVTFYPSGTYEILKSNSTLCDFKIDSLLTLLWKNTDNGATDSLKSVVEGSFPNQTTELYQDLMDSSPFLSDTVLKASISNEQALSNPLIKDILVANPQTATNEELLSVLDDRVDPMPDSLYFEILDGVDIVGDKEKIQSELSGWIQMKELVINEITQVLMADTINPWAKDSLVHLLYNDRSLSTKYSLVHNYLDNNQYTEAQSILNEIPIRYALTKEDTCTQGEYNALLPVLQAMASDTFGLDYPDSSNVVALTRLALENGNPPEAYARNILINAGLIDYNEPIVEDGEYKAARIFSRNKSLASTDFLKIYPNPASKYIIAEYKKLTPPESGSLSLLNSKGDILDRFLVRGNDDHTFISTGSLFPGVYLIRLEKDHKLIGLKKFTIIR